MSVYVFEGQGSQKKGMGGYLFDKFNELTAKADNILGYSIKELCLTNKENRLQETQYAQPAIYVVNTMKYLELSEKTNCKPDYVAGHSLGEYNALFVAGAFDFETGLKLVKKRGELMDQAVDGGMAAIIGLTEQEVKEIIGIHKLNIEVSNSNSLLQIVVSGLHKDIDRAKIIFEPIDQVKAFIKLKTNGPFHSTYMEECSKKFAIFLEHIEFSELIIPVISNVTARPYNKDEIASLLQRQITHKVRWNETIQYLLENGEQNFVEIGKGTTLTKMIDKIKYERKETIERQERQERQERRERQDSIENIEGKRDKEYKIEPQLFIDRLFETCETFAGKDLFGFYNGNNVDFLSGKQLADKVKELGPYLQDKFKPQENLIILFPQELEYIYTIFACWYANIVVVPLPVVECYQLEKEIEKVTAIIEDSGATTVLTTNCFVSMLNKYNVFSEMTIITFEEIAADLKNYTYVEKPRRIVKEEDIAIIMYTSGSTSLPKGVMLGHNTIINIIKSKQWSITSESKVLWWLPQFHAFGFDIGILLPAYYGAQSIMFTPDLFIKEPKIWFELIDTYKITHTGASNFVFEFCSSTISYEEIKDISLSSLEVLMCGGDIVRLEPYEKFCNSFECIGYNRNALSPSYGLTELAPIAIKNRGAKLKYISLVSESINKNIVEITDYNGKRVVSCGEIDDQEEVIILNTDTKQCCATNEIGKIWVSSPCISLGYFNPQNKEERDFPMIRIGNKDYFDTGDIGFLYENELYILGREKNVIIKNGNNYYSVDIENEIRKNLSGFAFTCVAFSVELDDSEEVVIVQEISSELTIEDCENLCNKILEVIATKFQIELYEILLVSKNTVPMTGINKISRKKCKQIYLDKTISVIWRYSKKQMDKDRPKEDDRTEFYDNTIYQKLVNQILIPELKITNWDFKSITDLSQLGVDSIHYIRIARKINQIFNITITPTNLYEYNSIHKIVNYIAINQDYIETNQNLATNKTIETNQKYNSKEKDKVSLYKDNYVIELLQRCIQKEFGIDRLAELIKERL